jgi:hypothetical protein
LIYPTKKTWNDNPFDDWTDEERAAMGRSICFGKGGGGSSSPPTQQVTTQTSLPAYAQPYYTQMMNQAQGLAQNAYTPFTGPQIQGFTPQQQQAFGLANQLGSTYQPAFNAANQNFTSATGIANSLANYTPQTITANYAQQQYAPTQFQSPQVGVGGWNATTAQNYMDPYQQAVTQATMQQIAQQGAQTNAANNAQAASAGAYGGDRGAVMNSLNNYYTNQLMAQQQAQGGEQAYQTGLSAFNQDRAAQEQAALANQQNALQAQQLGEQSRQFGATFGNQSSLAQAQLQQQAQLAQAQQQQAAANVGLQAGGLQLQAGQGQTWLGASGQRAGLADISALQQAGGAQQSLGQSGLDVAYQNYLNQLNWPYQQLSYESSLLSGYPLGTVGMTSQYQNPNQVSQLMGLGLGGLGAYQMASGAGII